MPPVQSSSFSLAQTNEQKEKIKYLYRPSIDKVANFHVDKLINEQHSEDEDKYDNLLADHNPGKQNIVDMLWYIILIIRLNGMQA